MNADGRPGIDVGVDLGARMPAVFWIAVGLLAAGAVLLAGGALLIVGAFPRDAHARIRTKGGVMSTPTISNSGPAWTCR